MTKRNAIILALFAGILAVAAPIIATLYLARQQSIHSQMAAVGAVANDVARRVDQTGFQTLEVVAKLHATQAAEPCSPVQQRLMGSLAIGAEDLQAVGYISDNQLLCSSLGTYGAMLPIGPPDYVSSVGWQVRTAVKFPLISDKVFEVLAAGPRAYAVIIDPELARDVAVPSSSTSLGCLSYSTRRVVSDFGYVDPKWLDKLGSAYEKDFSDGQRLVSLRRSRTFDTVAFAAVPVSSLDPILRHEAETLVPIGVVAGIVLAGAVLYLARIQLALPAVLKVALRRREFFVVYQPVVELQTRRWIGAEVLVRWRRPNGELIRPDVFIPVAEDTGLIHRLTEQIFEMVGHDAASLFERYPDFHLSINLAAADLATPDTLKLLDTLAVATHAKSGNLIVEATERGFIKTGVARELLQDIRSRGILVAIDDFGTGYSSLSYLQNFAIDILKIDKSFVDTIGTDAATSQVIFHIIEMAKGLRLKMTAEGIETESQADVLLRQGVQYGQGWLFAKPMPFSDLMARLGSTSSTR